VAAHACNGEEACRANAGIIAAHACNGRRACFNNKADIGPGECNGGPVNGKGVCQP
jgi:hypothetical protein